MEIKKFAQEVHQNAKMHGWWDGEERSFGELVALCHSELSEALEEYRNGREFTQTYYSCKRNANLAGECNGKCNECQFGKMEGIPSELADVVIRVFDMCEHYGIDIESVLKEKHNYNLKRPYKHGGKVI